MSHVPNVNDFLQARVTNPNQSEVFRQRFYDYQLYPTAGGTQFSFFALPVGQGITSAIGAPVGGPKTQWDTNLEMPNTLPSGKMFKVESIEVYFWPGSVSTANTFTPANLAFFNATASQANVALIGGANDINNFYLSGMLEFNVLAKNILRETPVAAFPPKTFTEVSGAVATNAAATSLVGIAAPRASGRPYYMDVEVTLQPAMNFEVLIRYPAAVATPSGFNGRFGVVLDGLFLRAA